jgi:hypothetical protein
MFIGFFPFSSKGSIFFKQAGVRILNVLQLIQNKNAAT